MNISRIYRKRIIPKDLIPLDDDIIVAQDEETLITKWKTLNPKTAFSHGCSCFFLKEGIKVSKVYRSDGSLLRWYCDIADFSICPEEESMTYTDLLADVIIDPEGTVKVVDLDELADAMDHDWITKEQAVRCLRNLNRLLSLIYRDKFDRLQARLEGLGL